MGDDIKCVDPSALRLPGTIKGSCLAPLPQRNHRLSSVIHFRCCRAGDQTRTSFAFHSQQAPLVCGLLACGIR